MFRKNKVIALYEAGIIYLFQTVILGIKFIIDFPVR